MFWLLVETEGEAPAAEETEEQEDTEEQDEEKMKTSDEVKQTGAVRVLLLHSIQPSLNFLSIPCREQLGKKWQRMRRCHPWSTTSSPTNLSLLTTPKVGPPWRQNRTKHKLRFSSRTDLCKFSFSLIHFLPLQRKTRVMSSRLSWRPKGRRWLARQGLTLWSILWVHPVGLIKTKQTKESWFTHSCAHLKLSFLSQIFPDIIRGKWAGFTLKEQEWTHPITTPSLSGT